MSDSKDVDVGGISIRQDLNRVTVFQGPDFFLIRTRQEARALIFALGDVFGTGAPEGLHASAVKLGRRGGKKGGAQRAKNLTATQRSDIARAAAMKRWHGT